MHMFFRGRHRKTKSDIGGGGGGENKGWTEGSRQEANGYMTKEEGIIAVQPFASSGTMGTLKTPMVSMFVQNDGIYVRKDESAS